MPLLRLKLTCLSLRVKRGNLIEKGFVLLKIANPTPSKAKESYNLRSNILAFRSGLAFSENLE
jgi:hypothetical protein